MTTFKKILTFLVYIFFGAFIITFGLSLFLGNEDNRLIFLILNIVFFCVSIISLLILFFLSPNYTLKEAKKLYKENKANLVSYVSSFLKEENMKLLIKVKKEDDSFVVENENTSFSLKIENVEKEEVLFLIFSLVVKNNFCSHSIKSYIYYFKNGAFKFKEPFHNIQIVDLAIINKNISLNKYIMNVTHEEDLNFDWRTYTL